MAFTSKLELTVGWGDCAPSGAVFYANYFRWFDQAMWAHFDAAGLPLPEIERQYGNVGFPLIRTEADFRGPCRLRDRLTIETSIVEWRRKTVTMVHHVRCGDTVAVEGRDVRFWGVRDPDNPRRLMAEVIPAAVVERFAALSQRPNPELDK